MLGMVGRATAPAVRCRNSRRERFILRSRMGCLRAIVYTGRPPVRKVGSGSTGPRDGAKPGRPVFPTARAVSFIELHALPQCSRVHRRVPEARELIVDDA